jgi:hypothetical protein
MKVSQDEKIINEKIINEKCKVLKQDSVFNAE